MRREEGSLEDGMVCTGRIFETACGVLCFAVNILLNPNSMRLLFPFKNVMIPPIFLFLRSLYKIECDAKTELSKM